MKAKLWPLALVLLVVAIALPANAQWNGFDDPAATPNDPNDHLMMSEAVVSSSKNSLTWFGAGADNAVFTFVVSACPTSCNAQLQIQAKDPDGTWYVYIAAAAVTATGTYRYIMSPGVVLGTDDFVSLFNVRLPPVFRVTVFWVSGTSISYTVQGTAF